MGESYKREVSSTEVRDYYTFDVVSEMRRHMGELMNGNVVYRRATADELKDTFDKRPAFAEYLFKQATVHELGFEITVSDTTPADASYDAEQLAA